MKPILPVVSLLLICLCTTAQRVLPARDWNTSALFSEFQRSLRPENPFMSRGGAAADRNDSYASGVSPQAGPGSGPVNISVMRFGWLCATLVLDRSGQAFACSLDARTGGASLSLLAPDNLAILASIDLPRSDRLSGFYVYMDQDNRVVLGAGDNHVLRITQGQDSRGHRELRIVNNWDVSRDVTGHCGSNNCDYFQSLMPDWDGRIWFSSENGVVGTLDPGTGVIRSTLLPKGERVANSMSSSPAGVALLSDHALYLFGTQTDGTPVVLWRETYDRGTKIKSGRLSQGAGGTPVFFGGEGHPYLAITDNADFLERLLVYRVKITAGNRLVCEIPLFSPGASASEDAPIGIGNSLVLSNTYGYDYTDYMGHAVKQLPGGMTRIDVRADGSGCDTVWKNTVRSVAVPRLSIRDGNVYTVERNVTDSTPQYFFVTVDFRTGHTLSERPIGHTYSLDAFQLPGVIGPHGVLYQPTMSGIIQVRPPVTPHSLNRQNAGAGSH
jgi:hypothetical protein